MGPRNERRATTRRPAATRSGLLLYKDPRGIRKGQKTAFKSFPVNTEKAAKAGFVRTGYPTEGKRRGLRAEIDLRDGGEWEEIPGQNDDGSCGGDGTFGGHAPSQRDGEAAGKRLRDALYLESIIPRLARVYAEGRKSCSCQETKQVRVYCIGLLGLFPLYPQQTVP